MTTSEVVFTRSGSLAGWIGGLIRASSVSVDAAIYRFNNPELATAMSECMRRGASLRLVLDFDKFAADVRTRELLGKGHFPFRLLRRGRRGKMHHKFAVLDQRIALTGSYNWTLESEEENYENLVILRDSKAVASFCREFELLWAEAASASASKAFRQDV